MEYTKFGNTGMMVSPLCLGTMSYGGPTKQFPWALTEDEIKQVEELYQPHRVVGFDE